MRTSIEIYEKYRIPFIIRMHQLRVAAVGKILAEKTPGADVRQVILTGLFHDMGNILKMDLFPDGILVPLIAPDTVAALQRAKEDFRAKYGVDEHAASLAIGREIGLPETVLDMIDNMRFLRTEWIRDAAPIEMKIAKYADLRVSPFGVVSMRDRFEEANKRYRGKAFDAGETYDADVLKRIDAACADVELVVTGSAGINPQMVNDEVVGPIIEELKKYAVS